MGLLPGSPSRVGMICPLTEERLRSAYPWIRAHVVGNGEAIGVLTDHEDLERLGATRPSSLRC